MSNDLSREELLALIDLSHRCLAAEDHESLGAILTDLGTIAPFDRAALCAPSAGPAPSLDHLLNHSFGARWGQVYAAERFERIDPVVGHSLTSLGAFRWRDALAASRSLASEAFFEAARDFGLMDGVAYVCCSRSLASRTLLSVAQRDDRGAARTMVILAALGPHLHEAYGRLNQRERGDDQVADHVELSAREQEILAWTQDGKTYWEIGQIIGISQRTVKYHFERIKAKLDVVSVSHAVAKAMRMGLLG